MENIEIRFVEIQSSHYHTGWLVKQNGKFADGLCYDEMLGLVSALTMPKNRPSLRYMKTREQVAGWNKRLKSLRKSNRK